MIGSQLVHINSTYSRIDMFYSSTEVNKCEFQLISDEKVAKMSEKMS